MKTKLFHGGVWASFLALFTSSFLAAGQSGGSVPVITGFSPALGPVGTVVNITGSNFSPTAANNIVYFGAVQATVQAASGSNLVVTVPAGATFAPITETVNGLTAYANAPFVPTFPASAPANFSLGSQLVLPAGSSPSGVVIADFDGDGKPDLAVDNGNSGTIEIYRNISTNGALTAGSFAPPITLPIGTGGSSPMVAADLTGDGKLDLICQDLNSNLVVVIKNLCTPGNITSNSFAPAVTFAVGSGPRGVAVQDLDGDGKPEIVSANFGDSTVSVLRNTSTPGIITSNSFALPIAFATGTAPQNVMIADMDGDGQPDLVTVDNNYYETSPAFSVLRNISTSTNINFESHVDFAGIQDTYCIAIGDLDGDGKPDVVIGSQGGNGPDGNSVSIYRNTSTPGSITTNSFAPAVNIPAGGWVNSVALGDLNGDGKLDIAAAMQIPSQLAVFLNTSTPGSISDNSFSAPLVFASGYNANGIAIGDLNGDGIPDIAFANSYDGTFSIYQNLTASGSSGGIPPYIITQPADQTVTAGNPATFSVTAGGTAPLSYQWIFDETNLVGTNATLTLGDVSTANAGVYQVFIENAYGSTDSVPATLTVNASFPPMAPYIITQPTNETAILGGTATFSVTAGGSAPLSYQWFFDGTNLVGTNATLILDDAGLADVGSYQAVISNPYGTTNSVSAMLAVRAPSFCDPVPSNIVAWWPGDGNADDIIGGNDGIVTNGTVGYAPAEVGLGFNFDGGPNRLIVPDAPALDMGSNVDFTIEGWIRAFPTNTPQGVMTIADKRYAPNNVQCQGYELSLLYGQLNLRISDDPSGNGNNWSAGPNLLDGQLHHIAVTVARDSTNGGNLYVDGTSVLQFDPTSVEGDLTTSEPLRIGNHPDPTYTAFFDGQIDELSIYKRALSSSEIAGIYQAGSAGKCVPLLHPMAPYITVQPINQTVVAGSLAIFSVTVEGAAPMSYQWFFDGTNVVGTNATLMLNDVSSADAGTYQAVISNAYGSTNSAAVTLTVDAFLQLPPVIIAQPTNETVTAGGTATFSVTAIGDAPLSYQWFFDGTNVVGTNATLVLSDVSSANAGVYQVVVANPYGSTNSVPATLTVSSSGSNGIVPVITAFSPALGATGTVVNISGLNFSPIASNNIVYFGAVEASVNSASATSLQVTVPAGATYGPITETVNGLTAYAQTPFLPTFPGNSALGTNTFAPGFNLAAGDGPVRVIAADLDGDGKPDLIVADDYGDDVLIYHNISTNGTLSAASFAPPVELPVGPVVSQNDAILGLAVGDFAGDGRLDIVVANRYTSEISIFQNLSSPGVLASNSFGARIDITVAGNPGAVAVMDVDGDGQPDVVTANYYSDSISVLRNIGTGGLLSSNSFAPPISFATGPAPYSLAVGDLDGDGRPDIITGAGGTGSLTNTISVLRNISTPGNIVLQPHQDFPGLGQANSVVIGDLDGDGKPDLVVSSGSSGQAISVYRNISTPGTVTLASPVNFALGGWGNTIAIGDMDGDGKPDLAVETQLPSQICLFRNTSVPGAFTTSSLAPPIVLPSGWNPNGIVLADLLGDGRPDLVFANTYDGTLTLEQNISAFSTGTGTGTAPYVIAQPDSQTVTAGGTANFSVTAGGTAPLSYQWIFDETNLVGTNATLSLDDVSAADAGTYQAFISNAYGSTNSVPVTLTVGSSTPPPMAPTIIDQSTNQTIMAGGTAYLSVAAEGTAPLSYQWFYDGTNLVGTNETLTLDDVSAADAGIYQAFVENAYGEATSAPIALTVSSSSSSCDPAPSGIVAWWPGEGNANDVIGTNNGTLEGSISFGPGEVGQAFLYTTTNDAVQIPASPSLNVGAGSGFTVEGWINPSDVSALHCIFEWNNGTSFGVHFYVSADPAPGTLYANVVDSYGNWHQMNSSVSPVTANVFQHVALTYDEASGTATMYYNGAIVGQQYLGSYTPQTTYDLYLGRRPPGIDSTWTFSGLIDEPSVYDRALSSNEVAAIFQAGSEGKCPPTPPTQGNSSIPAISSFSPTLGGTGTAVNISGLNFSPTASNNIVYFGAVQAPVESASATSLQVKVPAGATYAPITETVNGLTAYAKSPFVPTFATSAPTNFSLGPQLVMTASNMAWFVVIADLDGDGKPDLAVNNGNSHTIDIYRNISAGGTITSNSFAPPVVLPIGTGGQNVMLAADLTGDGKLDLVCLDENSNLVMVLKNLCTPGNIAFASAVNFAVGTDPRGVAVQDLDGDGKPEIVVANCGDSTLSVLRNLSAPGILNSSSFASPVVFATGTRPQDVMIADMDGDGQPDLVTVNNNYYENSPSMSVLRNISTSTNINFESHVDFAGIQDTYCIAIGDLDGDGKPDVVIGSQGGNGPDGNSVSIYRNTSTPGSITTNSFAPAVNIPAGGWVNSVALGDLNGDGKLDIAAAMQIPSQLAVFLNTSTPGSISDNSFSAPLVYASGYNANGIAIGDLNGDGLPDIAFANSYDGTFSIYQNLTTLGGSGGTTNAPQTVDHFSWNPISSPQIRTTPFTVTITARNAANDIVTNFTGPVRITATNNMPVIPPITGLVHGSWTGSAMVPIPATNLVLKATDVLGHNGVSNPFNVITRPLLIGAPFANGMQVAWPVSASGFVLEMSTNLASGNWAVVPGQPLQSNNMLLQPVTPAITNSPVFYRLHYVGQ